MGNQNVTQGARELKSIRADKRISIVGQQHDGKSSLGNTLLRGWKCLQEMECKRQRFPQKKSMRAFSTGAAGSSLVWAEATADNFTVADTPALVPERLTELLLAIVRGQKPGTRVEKSCDDVDHNHKPDVLILVVSGRRVETDADQCRPYLEEAGQVLRDGSQVAVPFAVAMTFADEVRDKMGASSKITEWMQCNDVFALVNYDVNNGHLPLRRTKSTVSNTDEPVVQLLSFIHNVPPLSRF